MQVSLPDVSARRSILTNLLTRLPLSFPAPTPTPAAPPAPFSFTAPAEGGGVMDLLGGSLGGIKTVLDLVAFLASVRVPLDLPETSVKRGGCEKPPL